MRSTFVGFRTVAMLSLPLIVACSGASGPEKDLIGRWVEVKEDGSEGAVSQFFSEGTISLGKGDGPKTAGNYKLLEDGSLRVDASTLLGQLSFLYKPSIADGQLTLCERADKCDTYVRRSEEESRRVQEEHRAQEERNKAEVEKRTLMANGVVAQLNEGSHSMKLYDGDQRSSKYREAVLRLTGGDPAMRTPRFIGQVEWPQLGNAVQPVSGLYDRSAEGAGIVRFSNHTGNTIGHEEGHTRFELDLRNYQPGDRVVTGRWFIDGHAGPHGLLEVGLR